MVDRNAQGEQGSTNRLGLETSPYLLQHRNNPVNWYPWGQEAFEVARRENKPLLISIGYSACHWCHVMERESFEDTGIAELINETVVPVKVDREERPDVDAIYMNACVSMNGQGGWPLNAFVTPDLKPFFIATYLPPKDGRGRPGFVTVLQRVREAWVREGKELAEQANRLHERFMGAARSNRQEPLEPDVVDRFVRECVAQFDSRHGGFGSAPKFPPDQRLALLLAATRGNKSDATRTVVTRTLEAMACGGIYDQLGGGFSRYSVDARWLVPHFEKMLYNQALLVPVYLDAFLATGTPLFRRVAAETLEWVMREMVSPEGVFYSALDADSEGEEGKYYVWTPGEIALLLGESDAAFFNSYYGIEARGNFEHGTTVLSVPVLPGEFARMHGLDEDQWLGQLEAMKQKVRACRSGRVPPLTDDKCLTGWNGLMITALCRGYQVLGDDRYLSAARRAAEFLLTTQRCGPGEILRCACKGRSSIDGMLEDYAFFVAGLIDLYESCFDTRYLAASLDLAEGMLARFWSEEDGVFFSSAGDDPSLIMRPLDLHDGATPSGAAMAAYVLVRLARIYDKPHYPDIAARQFEVAGPQANRVPGAFSSMLLSWMFMKPDTPEIVIGGNPDETETRAMIEAVWRRYLPFRVLVLAGPEGDEALPITRGRGTSQPTAFVCRDSVCLAPVHSAAELSALLSAGAES